MRRWILITLTSERRVLFAGSNPLLDRLVVDSGAELRIERCSLDDACNLAESSYDELVVIEDAPTPEAWSIIATLAARPKVRLMWEAMRQELLLGLMASKFPYLQSPEHLLSLVRSPPGESLSRLDRPIVEANEIEPFRGKRVIELGPLDGAQTASLVQFGAAEVVCVEIRPDNYLKSLLTADLMGARHVSFRLDNFHSVTASRYGTFDICIAHGVYYHSNAPFQLLANIASLAPVVVFGGFCATDASPASAWMALESEGHVYRAKRYSEVDHFTAGVSAMGYFFEAAAIQHWFRHHGFELHSVRVRQKTSAQPAGEFVSFVAMRAATQHGPSEQTAHRLA